MTRMYNVIAIVENPKMVNHGKRFQMSATPMTHKEACTFMSKQSKHWCRRIMLEEVAPEGKVTDAAQ